MTERLLETVAAVLETHAVRGRRVAVGLSGGVDSVVLLDVLGRLRNDFRLALSAIHVNHQISAHALEWEAFCKALCQVRRLRCYGPVQRGAGIAAERKRGPERFLFGDLTSEAIEGGGRSLLRLISGRIPNLKLGPLHRLDSRPACGNATV